MNSTAPRKHFTVEEANRRLPLVRAIVSDIVELHQSLSERRELFERVRGSHGGRRAERDESNPHEEELRQVEQELEDGEQRLLSYVSELHELGAELKDPAVGLVDFPTLMDGREVLLCWKHGEDEIAFWHELDAGFAGRQSLLQGTFTSDLGDPDGDINPSDD